MAVTTASQSEIVQKTQSVVRSADQPPNVDHVIYETSRSVQPTNVTSEMF